MAYRIRIDDGSVQSAVRRIANEQIDHALDEIAADGLGFAEKVHQVRKRCKKLRGLIRVVRPAFDDYHDENKAFRNAARLISGVRDASTLIASYDLVTEHFSDQIDRRAFAPIRGRLTRDARKVREDPETEARMIEVGRDLQAARVRAAKWKLSETGFDAVADGINETYKSARQRMKAARADRGDVAIHDWRKGVKYHWYHARLLHDVFPAMMAPHAATADALSNLLGDHHDMVVLDVRLRDAPEDFGTATDLEAFRALLRQRKEALGMEAFALGRLLLSERQEALVGRWGGYSKVSNAGKSESRLLSAKA